MGKRLRREDSAEKSAVPTFSKSSQLAAVTERPHQVELEVRRQLVTHPHLRFSSLVIRRIRNVLRDRRAVMQEALDANGLTIAGQGVHGGSSFWMQAPEGVDTQTLSRALRERDVLIEPGHAFFDEKSPQTRYYRLAYSSIPRERIPEGVARIAEAMAAL